MLKAKDLSSSLVCTLRNRERDVTGKEKKGVLGRRESHIEKVRMATIFGQNLNAIRSIILGRKECDTSIITSIGSPLLKSKLDSIKT